MGWVVAVGVGSVDGSVGWDLGFGVRGGVVRVGWWSVEIRVSGRYRGFYSSLGTDAIGVRSRTL